MTPFGRYLTTLRLNRRVKQKELAEALDVDPSYISAIESGKKAPPSNKAIQEIVIALKLPRDEELLLVIPEVQVFISLMSDWEYESF